jgi:hypothetical protein
MVKNPSCSRAITTGISAEFLVRNVLMAKDFGEPVVDKTTVAILDYLEILDFKRFEVNLIWLYVVFKDAIFLQTWIMNFPLLFLH